LKYKLNLKILLILLVLCTQVAFGIGISPPRIIAENMDRGGHIESTLYLSGLSGGEEVTITLEGEVSDWISIDKGRTFVFEKTESLPLIFSIDVPEDAANGLYSGTGTIQATPSVKGDTGQIGVSVISGVRISFTVDVTGEQIEAYSISAIAIPATEVGSPLQVVLTIQNDGNVMARPSKLHIDVMDVSKELMLAADAAELSSVAPHTRGKSAAYVPHSLPEGQYWADVWVYNGDTTIFKDKNIAIEILDAGSLKTSGLLRDIELPAKVKKGTMTKIEAVFENDGQKSVTAEFIGEIYSDGSMIEVVESDSSYVDIAASENLIVYFRPVEAGTYTIKGYVNYAGKKTEAKEATWTVLGEKVNTTNVMMNVAIISVIAVILIIGLAILKWRLVRRWP